jgi:hypothetical protein
MGTSNVLGRQAQPFMKSIDARACAGIQIGQVARLGYDYRISVREGDGQDSPSVVNQSHEVSLRKIAGTPLSISASYERADASVGERRDGRGQVSAAATSAATDSKFIKIGGEF